jgi:hypothetical protein
LKSENETLKKDNVHAHNFRDSIARLSSRVTGQRHQMFERAIQLQKDLAARDDVIKNLRTLHQNLLQEIEKHRDGTTAKQLEDWKKLSKDTTKLHREIAERLHNGGPTTEDVVKMAAGLRVDKGDMTIVDSVEGVRDMLDDITKGMR